ncbi:unnamed protein product [Nippostrongylus brasiliensis]|uniref:PiggyBac transposable element-derived protein 4 (inferred by orthology to a human protein) n=1 Tax=Nippostrongylus brasiliensis TaxID=27835 RepID=A0A0N4YIJ5_NIPBR|nr:unnamed protein product [Nippostrongylus brasiliensis]
MVHKCGSEEPAMAASSVSGCYSLYVDTILDHVVVETNRYGRQKNQVWKEVDEAEFKVFVALCLRMGYVKLPELRNYWCSSGDFGDAPICAKYMSRFRFEEILSHIHLNDNNRNTHDDRLFKARPVIEIFTSICGKLFRPSRKICIDESIVPFRGRIIFRQYIPNKRHRYGIKVFKLCAEGGYTWRIQVYAGKDPTRQGSVAQSAVMNLVDGLLDQGRTLFTDNWYTSVDLAEVMLSSNMVGTIRRNRVGMPKLTKNRKLKRGEKVAVQNRKGVVIIRWKDKRELFMLSTMHGDSRSERTDKPTIVHAYNEGKTFVDTSDQMASYSPFVRRTCK